MVVISLSRGTATDALSSQATGAALQDEMERCVWVGLLLLAKLQHGTEWATDLLSNDESRCLWPHRTTTAWHSAPTVARRTTAPSAVGCSSWTSTFGSARMQLRLTAVMLKFGVVRSRLPIRAMAKAQRRWLQHYKPLRVAW